MCRNSMNPYKTSYVCVPCRHVAQFHYTYGTDPYRCPHCRDSLTFAGSDFHAPRKRDDNGWSAVASVLASGKNYHSCGCTGPGYRPRTKAQVRQDANQRPFPSPNRKRSEW